MGIVVVVDAEPRFSPDREPGTWRTQRLHGPKPWNPQALPSVEARIYFTPDFLANEVRPELGGAGLCWEQRRGAGQRSTPSTRHRVHGLSEQGF